MANIITLIRIGLAISLLLIKKYSPPFLIVYSICGFTDILDGYIARNRNQVTTFGKFADPLADKILVLSAMLLLMELDYRLPAWIPIIVLTREFQKLASDVRSDEYATLQRVRKDYPDFSVGTRAIKKNPNKNTYKNLTYSYMEKYIRN